MYMDLSVTTSNCRRTCFESYLIQYKYFLNGALEAVAKVLENKLNSLGLVPDRHDVFGQTHKQTLQQYLETRPLQSIPDFLEVPHSLSKSNSSTASYAGTRKPTSRSAHANVSNHVRLTLDRELGTKFSSVQVHAPNLIEQTMERHSRVTGHIDRTYTVHFDRTGRYALTAADDCTIKVWDVNSAMLRFTFRGHFNLISDMCISYCNQFMASGGADKHVRVWSLQTGATVEVFRFHTALVTGLMFLPYVYNTKRFLCSYGYDCNVVFYEFDEETAEFSPVPTVFNIREAPGVRCVSSTYSPSGRWVAIGDTQGNVHLFHFDKGIITRDQQFRAIPLNERLDSLEWSHEGVAFVTTSSRFHVGRIWRFVSGTWKFIEFQPVQPSEEFLTIFASTKLKYGVCMVCWTIDDSHIVVSGSDYKIRVYDSRTGRERHRLGGHKGEAFHLRPHPINPKIVFSSAHDGLLMVWDVERGRLLKKFTSEVQDGRVVVVAAILDLAITEDGTRVATVDDLGRLTIYGLGSNDAHLVPREQFLLSDYEPLELDENGFGLDMATGIAPHLLPPGILVNMEKDFLEDKWQHKLPGKEEDLANNLCPWLNRSIVPKLCAQNLIAWRKDMECIQEKENGVFLNVSPRKTDSFLNYRSMSPDPPGSPSKGNGRVRCATSRAAPRQRNALPSLEDAIAAQDARRAEVAMQGYRSEDDESYSGSSASEDLETDVEDNTSDSDYSIGGVSGGPSRRAPTEERPNEIVTTSSGRRVQKRVLDGDILPGTSAPRPRPKKTQINNQEETGDTTPSTAHMEESCSVSDQAPVQAPRKHRKIRTDEFLKSFPDMMLSTKRQRFPFIPQLGDRVVYCKQGHERYIEQVESLQLYPISNRIRPRPELSAEEFCVIEEIKYTRKPYRLTIIRLAQEDRQGRKTGISFTVKMHDLVNCPDFLILRYHFDLSIGYRLQEGDEIESILDGHWWTGTVTRRQPRDEDHPSSNWFCLMIRWDNGEDDMLSPWDCQPKSPGRKSNTVATDADEQCLGDYLPNDGDWPGIGSNVTNREICCTRLIAAIEQLMHINTVEDFANPVSLVDFPEYPACVDYCIDLETISARLRNRVYRRLIAVQQEIRFIAVAAEQFNQPDSVIVKNSRILVETLIRFSEDSSLEASEIATLYSSVFDLPAGDIREFQRRQRTRLMIDPIVVEMVTTAEQENSNRPVPGWVTETYQALDSLMAHPSAAQFISFESTSNDELADVLRENGGLQFIRDQLTSFNQPADVLSRIRSLMDICKDAIDDNHSRLHDSAIQVDRLACERISPISQEYDRIVNTVALLGGRQLRRRKRIAERKAHYNTRSAGGSAIDRDMPQTSTALKHDKSTDEHRIEGRKPSSSRCLAQSNEASKRPTDEPTSSYKDNSGETSNQTVYNGQVDQPEPEACSNDQENQFEDGGPRKSSFRVQLTRTRSDSDDSDESSGPSDSSSCDRKLPQRCATLSSNRMRKRKRTISSDEEDVVNSRSLSSRVTRSTTTRLTRRTYREASEESTSNISQRGRLRRIRRFS